MIADGRWVTQAVLKRMYVVRTVTFDKLIRLRLSVFPSPIIKMSCTSVELAVYASRTTLQKLLQAKQVLPLPSVAVNTVCL